MWTTPASGALWVILLARKGSSGALCSMFGPGRAGEWALDLSWGREMAMGRARWGFWVMGRAGEREMKGFGMGKSGEEGVKR